MGGINNFALTDEDYAKLAARYIGPEQVRLNDIYRVDHVKGAEIVSRKCAGLDGPRYSGLVIPNYRVEVLTPRSNRLKRDFPDLKPRTDAPGLKEEGKYLWSAQSRMVFYYPFGNTRAQMLDPKIRLLFIEGEFKAISLKRVLTEAGIDALVIGLYGAHCWKGRTQTGVDETGPINDFDDLVLRGRDVTICRDANFRTNQMVKAGMRDLGLYVEMFGATAYYADTPELEGVNGLDDLAGLHGPNAVLEVLEARQRLKRTTPKREPLTDEQRTARAGALKTAASRSTESLAADVLGGSAAKHILTVWAEAGLSDEAVRLLIAWEAIAEGCDEASYFYADLYSLLYKCNGNEYEQTPTGGRVLKSSCRKKLADRIARLEAEQDKIKIRFADHISGKLDEFDNPVPSKVTLYSRQFVAEALSLAETMANYSRHKKETRNEAISVIVREKSGNAYVRKLKPKKNKNKQIADGLQRVKGNLNATIERIEQRGDSVWYMWEQVMEVLPDGLIDYIKAKGVKEYLGGVSSDLSCKDSKVTPNDPNPFHSQAESAMQHESEKDGFRVTSKTVVSDAESTDDFARFQKTCTQPAPDPVVVGLWAKTTAKSQAETMTLQWLRNHAPDAFNPSLYQKPQEHPDYLPEYERRFQQFYDETIADCERGKEVTDRRPSVKQGSEATPEMVADAFGISITKEADGSTVISSGADAASKHAANVRTWRETMGWQWSRIESGRPLRGDIKPETLNNPPDEVREEVEQLLEAMRNHRPTRDEWGKPVPVVKSRSVPLSQVLDDMDDFDVSGVN